VLRGRATLSKDQIVGTPLFWEALVPFLLFSISLLRMKNYSFFLISVDTGGETIPPSIRRLTRKREPFFFSSGMKMMCLTCVPSTSSPPPSFPSVWVKSDLEPLRAITFPFPLCRRVRVDVFRTAIGMMPSSPQLSLSPFPPYTKQTMLHGPSLALKPFPFFMMIDVISGVLFFFPAQATMGHFFSPPFSPSLLRTII